MSDFEKLKNMNLSEVQGITKISIQRLHDIINKDFGSLDSVRATGFINILERDLHLNLQEWLSEYHYFLKHGSSEGFIKAVESRACSDYKDSSSKYPDPKDPDPKDPGSQDSDLIESKNNFSLPSDFTQESLRQNPSTQNPPTENHFAQNSFAQNLATQNNSTQNNPAQNNSTQDFSIQEILPKNHQGSQVDSRLDSKNSQDSIGHISSAVRPNSKNIWQNKRSSGIEINVPKKPEKKNMFIIIAVVVILSVALLAYFIADVNKDITQTKLQETQSKAQNEQDIESMQDSHPKILLKDALGGDESENSEATRMQNSDFYRNDSRGGIKAQDSTDSRNQLANDFQSTSQDSTSQDSISMTIKAKKEVWFQWVDIKTKKGSHKLLSSKDEPFSLNTNNPIVFNFGNGLLTIQADGKKYDYNQGSPMYLLYTPNEGFKPITRREYLTLGGGK